MVGVVEMVIPKEFVSRSIKAAINRHRWVQLTEKRFDVGELMFCEFVPPNFPFTGQNIARRNRIESLAIFAMCAAKHHLADIPPTFRYMLRNLGETKESDRTSYHTCSKM